MFSLRETTRTNLCRCAFAAFCLLPTLAVASWCVTIRLPSYRHSHEQSLTAALGMEARLTNVSTPRSDTVLYEGVELADPDSGQLLARLPGVEVRRRDDMLEVYLTLPATIDGTRLAALAELAHRQVRSAAPNSQVHFTAENITVRLPGGEETLVELRGQIDLLEEHSRVKLTFRRALASSAPADTSEITILRRRHASPADTVVQLTTGETPLPCSLLATIWPGVAHLGRSCEFQGRVFAPAPAGSWQTEVKGHLTGVDLAALVGDQFPPHKFTGLAEVDLELVTEQEGRIRTASGRATAGPGVISRSLFESAVAQLHLQSPPRASAELNDLEPYDQWNVKFALDADGLKIEGDFAQASGAILLDARGRVLLAEPAAETQPAINLARALVSRREVLVPLTRESEVLLRTLPLPTLAAEAEQPLEAKRLRLRPQGSTSR